jgi:uncharacterized protein
MPDHPAMHTQRRSTLTKFSAILVTVCLAYGIAYGAAWLTHGLGAATGHKFGAWAGSLDFLYVHHAFQLALGLLGIAVVRHFVPADYGVHLPRGPSYIRAALLGGLLFGVLMTLVDYMPELLAGKKPMLGFPLTPGNAAGWLFFEGVYVGPTEEIPFRSLLVTYLAVMIPARLRIGAFTMNWAGVIVALIFALLHATNFETRHWPEALGQQIYAFALGVLYAYWLEKSRSVLAPAIGHNTGDVVEYAIVFLWVLYG